MCTKQSFRLCAVSLVPMLLLFMVSTSALADIEFSMDSFEEWDVALSASEPCNVIEAMEDFEWQEYKIHWLEQNGELPEGLGESFLPPELYVYGGDETPGDPCGYPDDAGLIMVWGEESPPPPYESFASGWKYVYGVDPDLTNCTITLKVHPPPAIVNVSFGLEDINTNKCTWSWTCGAVPNDIPSSPPPTTITINTNNLNASSPMAGSIAIHPSFDITQVTKFFINETFHNAPGVFNAPPPGGGSIKFNWNAWDEFSVAANSGGGGGSGVNSKWFTKWSQPPVLTEDDAFIVGWDERSLLYQPPIMADDWKCTDERPVTDIHWWGSFLGWSGETPPPVVPKAFHIGIWTDVPDPDPCDSATFSHPNKLIWENYCECYVWNYAGIDLYSRLEDFTEPIETRDETCFQFAQFLSQDEWFWQDPCGGEDGTVYWLSIAAIYDPEAIVEYPWGWKTREHFYNDDSVRIRGLFDPTGVSGWPTPGVSSLIGWSWEWGEPVEYFGESWDLAFELTTNEPGYADDPIPGDLNADKIVNLIDFAILAEHWLEVAP